MDDTPRSRSLIGLAFLAFIMVGLPNGALNVAWLYMQRSFEVSLDSIGVLLGAITIGRLLLSFYSGRLIAQMSMGLYLLGGSLIMLVGLAGFMLLASWPLLIVAAFIYGLGSSMLNTGVNTFAAVYYRSGRMNWLHAWYGFGSALGPLLVTFIVIDAAQSWRWAYVVLVALQVVLVVGLGWTFRQWQLPSVQNESARPRRVPARETLHIAAVWFGMALFFLHGGLQIGTGQLSSSLLVEGRGLDARLVGTWISIYWAGLTVGRIVTGLVIDRIGNVLLLRLSMLGTVGGVLLLWLHPSDLLSFIGIALIGLTLGPILPTLLADTPERTGALHSPNTVGFQIAASGVGLALLPGVAAFVAARAGLEIIGPFLMALAVISYVVYEVMVSRERRKPVLAAQL